MNFLGMKHTNLSELNENRAFNIRDTRLSVSKPGQYLLTGMLAMMLAIAPLRTVMALSVPIEDQCVLMVDPGSELQQPGQASTDPDSDQSNQAPGQGCCDDNDTCASDCHACTSLSYAVAVTPPVKTARQHLSNSGFIAGAVPLRDLAPLLPPPVTLHS
jgi:hypothetical protein